MEKNESPIQWGKQSISKPTWALYDMDDENHEFCLIRTEKMKLENQFFLFHYGVRHGAYGKDELEACQHFMEVMAKCEKFIQSAKEKVSEHMKTLSVENPNSDKIVEKEQQYSKGE